MTVDEFLEYSYQLHDKYFMKNQGKDEFLKIFKKSSCIDIYTHSSPDGDAIGSSIGLGLYGKKLNKEVRLFCEGEIPVKYNILPVDMFKHEKPSSPADLCIVLDSAEESRLGKTFQNILKIYKEVINIDHHPENPEFGSLNIVDPSAASASEILTEILFSEHITEDIAQALYIAMLSDTYGFSLSNVTGRTFFLASHLVEHGANPSSLWHKLYADNPLNVIKFYSWVLLNSQTEEDVLYAKIPLSSYSEFNVTETETESIANRLLQVKDIDTVVLMREKVNSVRISFRSSGKRNVGKLAVEFDGGGHKLAAGATIRNTLERTYDIIREKLKNKQNYSV